MAKEIINLTVIKPSGTPRSNNEVIYTVPAGKMALIEFIDFSISIMSTGGSAITFRRKNSSSSSPDGEILLLSGTQAVFKRDISATSSPYDSNFFTIGAVHYPTQAIFAENQQLILSTTDDYNADSFASFLIVQEDIGVQ